MSFEEHNLYNIKAFIIKHLLKDQAISMSLEAVTISEKYSNQ
jgi:hypothetical protein